MCDTLVERKAIRLDEPHVYLASETSEPLGESNNSDALEVEPFGPTGRDSDAIRTETGRMTEQPPLPVTVQPPAFDASDVEEL
ncbi:hypothetical protein D9M71_366370 [compost metagenome]